MNCWHCNKELIWGGDFDYEDYDLEGDGIVSNLSCPNCEAYVEVYWNNNKKKEIPDSIKKILIEKDKAMKRYTDKIRKENKCQINQKQKGIGLKDRL